jgi:hypothetical protein
MLRFLLLATFLLVVASQLTTAGLVIPAALLFPLPVGLYWAGGHPPRSLALVAVAALAAFSSSGSLALAAVYVIVADLGLFLGAAATRHWRFGWCVAVLTTVMFSLGAGNVLLHWSSATQAAHLFLSARVAQLQDAAREQAGEGGELNAGSVDVIEAVMWMQTHVEALLLGAFFGAALLLATAFTWVYQQSLRRAEDAGISGAFRTMRPPDWLVWLAIALAGMWLIEHRWPNEALRNVTWNAALGLSFVYWLNGLSIAAYLLLALQWHPLLVAACMGMLMAAQLGSLLSALGLFDTWYGFRERIDRILAARRQRAPGQEQ